MQFLEDVFIELRLEGTDVKILLLSTFINESACTFLGPATLM